MFPGEGLTVTGDNGQIVMTRRACLLSGALGMAVATGCVQSRPTPANRNASLTGSIDAHSHVWSADVERFPLGPWVTKSEMKPASFTAEQLLEIAKPNGVDRIVLIQHSPYFGYDPAYLLDCCRRYPGVFSVVGMIDERVPDLAPRLQRLVAQGVRGIRINPTIHGDRTPIKNPKEWLTTPGMQALWEVAAQQRVALCPLLSADLLPTLDPMCERFPDTICVIDHFGHVHSSPEDRVGDLLRLARHRQVYVKLSGFYKFGNQMAPYGGLTPLIRRVIDVFGPKRLMWGSDCPYQVQNGNTYADSIGLIRNGLEFTSASDRQAILRDTCERIFFS